MSGRYWRRPSKRRLERNRSHLDAEDLVAGLVVIMIETSRKPIVIRTQKEITHLKEAVEMTAGEGTWTNPSMKSAEILRNGAQIVMSPLNLLKKTAARLSLFSLLQKIENVLQEKKRRKRLTITARKKETGIKKEMLIEIAIGTVIVKREEKDLIRKRDWMTAREEIGKRAILERETRKHIKRIRSMKIDEIGKLKIEGIKKMKEEEEMAGKRTGIENVSKKQTRKGEILKKWSNLAQLVKSQKIFEHY